LKNWNRLFQSAAASGVYAIDRDQNIHEVEKAAGLHGLLFINIDLSCVSTKEDFLTTVARSLQFPAYFGMNWDAFEECLTDLSWYRAKGFAIVFTSIRTFAENAPGELGTARNILKSSAAFWKKQNIRFFVFLPA
jgi:hypothetical protein